MHYFNLQFTFQQHLQSLSITSSSFASTFVVSGVLESSESIRHKRIFQKGSYTIQKVKRLLRDNFYPGITLQCRFVTKITLKSKTNTDNV